MEETKIGNNIVISGFGEVEPDKKAVVNKMVGDYARRFQGQCEKFQRLQVTMKGIHAEEKAHKFEINGKLLDNGRSYTSEVVDHDLLASLDKALKKLENSVVR